MTQSKLKSCPPRRLGRVVGGQTRNAGGQPIFCAAAWKDTREACSRVVSERCYGKRHIAGIKPRQHNSFWRPREASAVAGSHRVLDAARLPIQFIYLNAEEDGWFCIGCGRTIGHSPNCPIGGNMISLRGTLTAAMNVGHSAEDSIRPSATTIGLRAGHTGSALHAHGLAIYQRSGIIRPTGARGEALRASRAPVGPYASILEARRERLSRRVLQSRIEWALGAGKGDAGVTGLPPLLYGASILYGAK